MAVYLAQREYLLHAYAAVGLLHGAAFVLGIVFKEEYPVVGCGFVQYLGLFYKCFHWAHVIGHYPG